MAKIIFEKNIEIPMRDGCVLRGDLFRPDTPEKLPVHHQSHALQQIDADGVRTHDGLDARGGRRLQRADPGLPRPLCLRRRVELLHRSSRATATTPSNGPRVSRGPTATSACTARRTWARRNGSPRPQAPPHLKCISPLITASDYHDGWTYQGGAFSLFFNVSWTMGALAPARLLRERDQNGSDSALLSELGATIGSIDRDARENGFSAAA